MEVLKRIKIPLFPLETVLFPGGVLPLRIFEPRYLDMVSECLKSQSGIGVVLIENGWEVGTAAKTHEVGTLSYISYWHTRNDGMLGITLMGEQRFRIITTEIKPNQSITAEVELLPNIEYTEIENDCEILKGLLKQIISQLEPPFTTIEKHYDNLEWVSARLTELLPLRLVDKQKMLNIATISERISCLTPLLVSLNII